LWLLAGLGNPGAQYEDTRHNIGWMLVAALREAWNTSRPRLECGALVSSGRRHGEDVYLIQPLSYMNLSGRPVKTLMRKYDVKPEKLLVICDDTNLPLGNLRIRPKGSDGGHKGLQSIMDALGSEEYARLRLGVGAPSENQDMADWVLKPLTGIEWDEVAPMLRQGINAVEAYLDRGMEAAQSLVNARRYQSQEEGR
jgi:PTH1 family peptidyl-tRNA hydrolase